MFEQPKALTPMTNRLVLLLLLVLFQSGAFAAVYKCERDGKVAYQASPCANGSDISDKVNQPVPVALPASGVSVPSEKKKCVGKEMSISFKDIPLKSMLSLLADFSGYKLEVDPSVSGSAPFSYQCIAWDAVLQDVVTRHDLIVKIENGTIFARKR